MQSTRQPQSFFRSGIRIAATAFVLLIIGLFIWQFAGTTSMEQESEAPKVLEKKIQPTLPTAQPLLFANKEIIETHDVPFTSQAPFGEWDDPRQQDGCEEASVLMTVAWARGDSLTRNKAKKEILAMAAYQEKQYGNFHDTSAKDTMERLLKGYFGYTNIELKIDITAEDIQKALNEGALVIVPVNGQLLQNPYFTAPGPERHMLVVTGYHPATDRFVTNDPGTKRGKGYQYSSDTLMRAIRDYPTGDHKPITDLPTAMIIVRR